MKLDKGLLISIALYLITFAFSYGVFSQRISSIESSLQDMKADIHEIRQAEMKR